MYALEKTSCLRCGEWTGGMRVVQVGDRGGLKENKDREDGEKQADL